MLKGAVKCPSLGCESLHSRRPSVAGLQYGDQNDAVVVWGKGVLRDGSDLSGHVADRMSVGERGVLHQKMPGVRVWGLRGERTGRALGGGEGTRLRVPLQGAHLQRAPAGLLSWVNDAVALGVREQVGQQRQPARLLSWAYAAAALGVREQVRREHLRWQAVEQRPWARERRSASFHHPRQTPRGVGHHRCPSCCYK